MFDHRASVRYAKPLIDLSISKGVVDDVQKDVNLFLDTCKSNYDFSLMLKNPIIPLNKKVDILREIFSKIFHDLTLNTFVKIIYNNRDHILENICKKFLELYNKHKNIQDVTLTTTIRLDKPSLDKIKSKLKKLTTKSISINQKINSNIIGGFILKVDDKMYDASYRTKLKNIKKTLLNN
tara:strand:- start:478 stop:1017 length:540 start_codon:yes stop_codon:yes gene_type:complete